MVNTADYFFDLANIFGNNWECYDNETEILTEDGWKYFFDLKNEKKVLPVSVLLNGEYGQHDVYASVPAVLGINGVEEIIELNMTPEEKKEFDASCKIMKENYKTSLTL